MVRKLIVTKQGGTASKNAVTYRLTLPAEMVKSLGITPEDRSVELEMVGDTLTIRKVKEEK
nr:MAG TPA: Transition state regulatory protein abrB HOMODIMER BIOINFORMATICS [Caudoviricetes sp.]